MTQKSRRTTPKQIFDDPDQFLDFLTAKTDRDFEGQHFDRKEICRPNEHGGVSGADLKRFRNEQIVATLSGFANENREGGLLVLGIGSTGQVPGIDHLDEKQLNSISSFDYLTGHNCVFKLHKLDVSGKECEVALIYAPFVPAAICQTAGKSKRAWRRSGTQNIEMSDDDLEAIRRNKRIVDYERTHCSRYSEADLDQGVYKEYAQNALDNASYQWTPEQLLAHIGALDVTEEAWFTNAGKLFFSANPGRDIPQAHLRVVRFGVPYEQRDQRRTATYDKNFTGPITKQIRDFRAFIKESAFFDTYQRRKSEGGFIEEPEYPAIAIDEAIVNAVAHRDYAIPTPILCEKYMDAFVVISPGHLLQSRCRQLQAAGGRDFCTQRSEF